MTQIRLSRSSKWCERQDVTVDVEQSARAACSSDVVMHGNASTTKEHGDVKSMMVCSR